MRAPEREEARWLSRLKEGDPEELEVFLRERDLHPSQTRGLPDEQELWADPPADVRSGVQVRRQRREDDRGRRRASVDPRLLCAEADRTQSTQSTEAVGSKSFSAEAERPQRLQITEDAESQRTAEAEDDGAPRPQPAATVAKDAKEELRSRGGRREKKNQRLKEEVVQELLKFDKSQPRTYSGMLQSCSHLEPDL